MRTFSNILSVLCLFATSVHSVSAVNPIEVDGTILKDSVTGQRFFVHGAGYDYAIDDSAESMWRPALDLLLETVPLVNSLRLYEVDPSKTYKKFIEYTNSKGIYLFIPMTPSGDNANWGFCAMAADASPLFPGKAGEETCYPSCLLEYGQRVINIFGQSPNTLAFIVGNEIITTQSRWAAAPCIKAYTRDLKRYMNNCSSSLRKAPLIYADADNSTPDLTAEQNNRLKADYLSCGPEEERIDIYGYNVFRWCGVSCTFDTCGWKSIHDTMSGVGIPLIFSEHGCGDYWTAGGVLGQRDWLEVQTLYSSDMTDTFSGGNAYTYGIRGDKGDQHFSFFSDGSTTFDGYPGGQKNCAGSDCNADNYSTQLNKVLKAGIPIAYKTSSRFASGDPVCPTYNNFNLTTPTSRQGAPGYNYVACPASSNPSTQQSTAQTQVQASTALASTVSQSTGQSQQTAVTSSKTQPVTAQQSSTGVDAATASTNNQSSATGARNLFSSSAFAVPSSTYSVSVFSSSTGTATNSNTQVDQSTGRDQSPVAIDDSTATQYGNSNDNSAAGSDSSASTGADDTVLLPNIRPPASSAAQVSATAGIIAAVAAALLF